MSVGNGRQKSAVTTLEFVRVLRSGAPVEVRHWEEDSITMLLPQADPDPDANHPHKVELLGQRDLATHVATHVATRSSFSVKPTWLYVILIVVYHSFQVELLGQAYVRVGTKKMMARCPTSTQHVTSQRM